MAFKAKVLRTEQEIVSFFNSSYVAKSLRIFAISNGPEDGKLGKLHFNFNGPSYTDMTNIEIGVPAYMVGKTNIQLIIDLKWRICHEQGHRMYTPDEFYKMLLHKLANYFHKTYGIPESLAMEMAGALLNGIEDGREEARYLENHPQQVFLDMFRYGRSQWYLSQDMSKGPRANSHEPVDELFDCLFCLCTLATMGTFPLGWVHKWQSKADLYQLMMDSRKYINAFVDSKTLEDAEKPFWGLINHLETWLADIMQKIPVQDAQNTLQQASSAMGGNAAQNNTGNSSQSCASNAGVPQGGNQGSGSQGGNSQSGNGTNGQDPMNNVSFNSQDPNSQQNQNAQGAAQGQSSGNQNGQDPNGQAQGAAQGNQGSSSPMHAAFDNDANGTGGNGGRIARMEDEYDGDYGTDMEKIVAEAMRNAEESLAEGETNSLIQAEFKDLLDREKEEAIHNGDVQAAQAVAKYYSGLNPNKRGGNNWNVPFKKVNSNLPQVTAPADIKSEAKILHARYKKILVDKEAVDSRNRRSGLLDTHSLHRLIGVNAQDVFMKKGNARDSDFVFYVLMDGSGSMSGRKFNEALRACSLIEEVLKGIAPVKIVVFDYSNSVRHHIVKEFKESPYNASWAYANTCCASGCNMDGFSIRVAKNELMSRPERHKVLITLSDGQPNGPSSYSGTRGENDVNEAVRDARKQGVRVFNIFFAESAHERKTYLPSFMHMYGGKGVIACEPANIGTELLRVVTKELQ